MTEIGAFDRYKRIEVGERVVGHISQGKLALRDEMYTAERFVYLVVVFNKLNKFDSSVKSLTLFACDVKSIAQSSGAQCAILHHHVQPGSQFCKL